MKPEASIRTSIEDRENLTPEYIDRLNNALAGIFAKRAYDKKLADRRAYHEAVLNKMVDPEFSEQVRTRAFQRIAIWRNGKTCSEFYSATWERIMGMETIEEMKQAILYDQSWAEALQQNSPLTGWKLEDDA